MRRFLVWPLWPLILVLVLLVPPIQAGDTPAEGNLVAKILKPECARNPLGVEAEAPRLSWVPRSARENLRDQHQSAYRILVASRPQLLKPERADLWDGGKVTSGTSVNMRYAGKTLHSGQRVYWAVRVWDENGDPSAFSEAAYWAMRLLESTEWEGQWIKGARSLPNTEEGWYGKNPVPLLRTEFGSGPIMCWESVRSGAAYGLTTLDR